MATIVGAGTAASAATLAYVVVDPCGSASTRRTRRPWPSHSDARAMAVVVLPDPPFCPASAMIMRQGASTLRETSSFLVHWTPRRPIRTIWTRLSGCRVHRGNQDQRTGSNRRLLSASPFHSDLKAINNLRRSTGTMSGETSAVLVTSGGNSDSQGAPKRQHAVNRGNKVVPIFSSWIEHRDMASVLAPGSTAPAACTASTYLARREISARRVTTSILARSTNFLITVRV